MNSKIVGRPLFKEKPQGRRVWEIDFLRGFCILLMIFDHAMYDFASLRDWFSNFTIMGETVFYKLYLFANRSYWNENYRIVTRIVVICVFLFLSGISCSFSRNNGLRAVKLAVAALGFTFATLALTDIFGMEMTILFGILHCLALSVAIYAIMTIIFKSRIKYACLWLGLMIMLCALTYDYYYLPDIADPITFEGFMDLMLGFGAYGADYFGVIPYTGVFLMGAYCGKVFYSKRKSLLPKLDKAWHKPLTFIGRNTMWVYILHQPIVMGIIGLIALAMGYKF